MFPQFTKTQLEIHTADCQNKSLRLFKNTVLIFIFTVFLGMLRFHPILLYIYVYVYCMHSINDSCTITTEENCTNKIIN